MRFTGLSPLDDWFIVPVKVSGLTYGKQPEEKLAMLPKEMIIQVMINADSAIAEEDQIDEQIEEYISHFYGVGVEDFQCEVLKDGRVEL